MVRASGIGETAADADRTRTGRGAHDRIQRNGRGPDANRTRAWPLLHGHRAWGSVLSSATDSFSELHLRRPGRGRRLGFLCVALGRLVVCIRPPPEATLSAGSGPRAGSLRGIDEGGEHAVMHSPSGLGRVSCPMHSCGTFSPYFAPRMGLLRIVVIFVSQKAVRHPLSSVRHSGADLTKECVLGGSLTPVPAHRRNALCPFRRVHRNTAYK
eukprot:gene413-biopygen7604